MVSSSIKSAHIEFGKCNKDILEEVIFYGISLGADFVELFIENTDNSNVLMSTLKLMCIRVCIFRKIWIIHDGIVDHFQ